MTQNRRIILNIVATYGRSLYSMLLGLFAARWVLAALGTVDFGLYGVIGGLIVFVAFINNLLQMAVVRFYGVKIGEANVAKNSQEALEECRKWFNTSFLIHLIVPVALVLIGYPIGEWAVRSFLVIPPNRISDCLWVWRFACFSCLVGMVTVPFQAMYTAKQEIAELTLYGFATTTLNTAFFYYMASHPDIWLMRYALWMSLMSVVPNLIIAIRAVVKYQECRFRLEYLWSGLRVREIFVFAGARFITACSGMFLNQGVSVLANRFFGPVFNAAMTIGGQVSGQAATFSNALSAAFWPAIANAAGERNIVRMKALTFMTCRFGSLLILIFIIPLVLEIRQVLHLWLGNPPDFAAELCVVIMISYVLERSTEGYWMAVFGVGQRVAHYSFVVGWTGLVGFFVAWGGLCLTGSRWSVCGAYLVARILTIILRLCLGRKLVGLSVAYWIRAVAIPLTLVTLFSLGAGLLPRMFMNEGFFRICMTVVAVELVIFPLLWYIVLTVDERQYIKRKVFLRR